MKERKEYRIEKILRVATQAHNRLIAHLECPPEGDLFYYIHGELSELQHSEIEAHIKQCLHCRAKVLDMDVEHIEWDCLLEAAYQEGHNALADTVREDMAEKKGGTDGLIRFMVDEIWEIEGTGMAQTAAPDALSQQSTLEMEDGTITIHCQWGPQDEDEPAYIGLAWEADLKTEGTLRVQFVNPETRDVRYEDSLGIISARNTKGYKTFRSTKLGFDPSSEKVGVCFQWQT